MYFPILKSVQNESFTSWKIGDIYSKMFILKFNLQDKDQWYANCLFYILII